MVPALRPGQLLWVSAQSTAPLTRGDIVLVRLERPPNALFLKRIVGLPGEKVEIRGGRILINGNPLPEPYVPKTSYLEPKSDLTFSLEPGAYCVLGDARDDSLDSRRFGPVSRREITGRVTFRLWPPSMLKSWDQIHYSRGRLKNGSDPRS